LFSRNKKGEVIKIFPYGGEEWLRYEQVLEILAGVANRYLEKLISKKQERAEKVSQILDEPDKKNICRVKKRKLKRYNLSQVANILDVPRQSLYYWIKKGWIKPRRDYRRYPVFTVFDIEEIIKWRNTTK